MKIVFLDIDGVLNHWGPGCGELIERNPDLTALVPKLCDDNVNAFNCFMCRAQASWNDVRIVVSSSWRKIASLGTIKRHLHQSGVAGEVIDRTPSLLKQRGDEILHWLEENQAGCPIHVPTRGVRWAQIDGFVILDDDSDMGPVMPWLVQMDGSKGFTMDDVDRAMFMLHGGGVPWR